MVWRKLHTPLTITAESPLRDAGAEEPAEDDLGDERQDEFLGALAALGGSAGNGRLRDVLEWDEASYDAVKAQLLSRRLILPGRGRGGSVALADGDGHGDVNGDGSPASAAAEAGRPTRRPRAARGSSTTIASSSSASRFDQAFRAIDDCLRKEAGCGTELDYTEQTSWLLFLKYLDGLEDDKAATLEKLKKSLLHQAFNGEL